MNQELLFARHSIHELRFDEFDAKFPEVWKLFCRFTLDAIAAGRRHFGARAVIERIRWFTDVESRDSSGFKINDHYAPYYARKFVRLFPQHAGIFELRKLTSEGVHHVAH